MEIEPEPEIDQFAKLKPQRFGVPFAQLARLVLGNRVKPLQLIGQMVDTDGRRCCKIEILRHHPAKRNRR